MAGGKIGSTTAVGIGEAAGWHPTLATKSNKNQINNFEFCHIKTPYLFVAVKISGILIVVQGQYLTSLLPVHKMGKGNEDIGQKVIKTDKIYFTIAGEGTGFVRGSCHRVTLR